MKYFDKLKNEIRIGSLLRIDCQTETYNGSYMFDDLKRARKLNNNDIVMCIGFITKPCWIVVLSKKGRGSTPQGRCVLL